MQLCLSVSWPRGVGMSFSRPKGLMMLEHVHKLNSFLLGSNNFSIRVVKNGCREFPVGPVVRALWFHYRGVQSLAGELRSHKLRGWTIKKKSFICNFERGWRTLNFLGPDSQPFQLGPTLLWSPGESLLNFQFAPFHSPNLGGRWAGTVQFSRSVVSNSLQPHGLQHTRLPCPSPTPGAYSNSTIESVMPTNHLILCHPLLLLPSIFPSLRVFSSESVLHIRWPKYWSFSFNISPSNEYSGLISFSMDWLDLLDVQGTLTSKQFPPGQGTTGKWIQLRKQYLPAESTVKFNMFCNSTISISSTDTLL